MVDRGVLKWLGQAFPCACSLCGGIAREGPVCRACLADLPWIAVPCARCGLPLETAGLCGRCARVPPPVDRTIAALEFRGSARALVHGLKFRGELPLARPLGAALARAVAEQQGVTPDRVIPVPLHARRLRQRGFNQAVEVSRVVGERLRLDVVRSGGAVRNRSTVSQTELENARARQRNVAGVFHVERRVVAGRRIALVDDVMTTGATLYELARAVRAAGATRVEAWVCCRARGRETL